MRKAFIDYDRGNPRLIAPQHLAHCLDSLRQDLMCYADDTPMPTINKPDHIGDQQIRQCRGTDRVAKWSTELERNACYHRITDYVKPYHKLERYAFCPKESKYYPVVQAYFEKWGHHDMFHP